MVRGHSEQFGRDAVALVESASFPNGQVVADPGISRSSLQAWLREGPACLARPVALARSHAIAPPWAPPRPDGRRPAWAYMRASKTYGAAERPATASAGRRLQACQPRAVDGLDPPRPSYRRNRSLRLRIPVPPSGFHGYDQNPRGLASSVGAVGICADDAATGILLSACPRKQQAQPLRLGHSQPAPLP